MAYSGYIWLATVAGFIGLVQAQCDPLTTSNCAPIPGLNSEGYFIDFTEQRSQSTPDQWILANYENVAFGNQGAEFTFNKRFDAPYLWTDWYFWYGSYEVVAQAAPGVGVISSSVLLSDTLDEVDWEWSGNNFGTSAGKVQTNYWKFSCFFKTYGKGITGNYDRGTQPAVTSPQTEFHTYTVDWTPSLLTWSVDGTVLRTQANSGDTSGAYQFPQTPMRVHLGLWDAGDASTSGGTVGWAGGYTNLSLAPFTFYVKSVKVENTNPCPQYHFADQSGSSGSVRCLNSTISSSSSTSAPTTTSTTAGSSSTAIPTTSVLPTGPITVYLVVSGDTGYGIATKVGTTFANLSTLNPSVNWDLLLIGQSIQVPGSGASTTRARPPNTSMSSKTTATPSTPSAPRTISAPSTSASPSTAKILSSSTSSSSSSSMSSSSQVPTSIVGSTTTYTVVSGDYGYGIAAKMNTTFEILEALNPGVNWDLLLIGQTFVVPGSASLTSAISSSLMSSSTPTTSPLSKSSTVSSLSSLSSFSPTSPSSTISSTSKSSTASSSSSSLTVESSSSSSNPIFSSKSSTTSSSSSSTFTNSSTKSTSTSITPVPVTSTSSKPATTTSTKPLVCNQDNCLRNMMYNQYASPASVLCRTYTKTASLPIPTWLGGCGTLPSRVSSACSCIMQPTATPTPTSTSLAAGGSRIAAPNGWKRGWPVIIG